MEESIKIVPLEGRHIKQTAELHLREMPKDLSSKMGISVVQRIFHEGMLLYPQSIGLVAQDGDDVVGFAFAQIDFSKFSRCQRKRVFTYYPIVGLALIRKPWLFPEALSALGYLRSENVFINLGPFVVKKEYRSLEFSRKNKISIACVLASALFEKIKERSPDGKVLTMIRPDNLASIAAVSAGALSQGFNMYGKSRINFGSDNRIIYRYRLKF